MVDTTTRPASTRALLSRWRADADPAASHGSAALRDLGVTGARGEATSGFATVVHVGLPAYRARLAAYGDDEDALRWALVRIIAVNADTNLVAAAWPGWSTRAAGRVGSWRATRLRPGWSTN